MTNVARKKPGPPKGEGGRLEIEYNDEIAKEICFLISTTKDSIEEILKKNISYPKKNTFYRWLFDYPIFSNMYREAKERQQEVFVASRKDEVEWARKQTYRDLQGNDKIDPGAVALAKLICDEIKWDASKYAPRLFGNKNEEAIKPKEDTSKNSEEINNINKQHEKPY